MTFSKVSLFLLLGLFSSNLVFSQTALKRANKQYELSDFAAAAESYKEVLGKSPDHLEANSRIADCYRLMNQLDKALPHYQSAVAQGNIQDLYLFQYGLTLQGLGRYEFAQKVFDQLTVSSSEFRSRSLQFSEACKMAATSAEPARFSIKPEYLNTAATEFAPTFFAGERIVYASSRPDVKGRSNRNAPQADLMGGNRLLITQRDKNGFLESPVTLHEGIGGATGEGPIAYSTDGRWVAITKNNFTEGVRQIPSAGVSMNLYLAQPNTNGSWSDARPFQYNGTGFSNGYPSFSPDGKTLYFASDRPGGYGGFDLYVCYRAGENWSSPENLGQPVNSQGNEISPFFDGMSLYFSSDFHQGLGGMDIFRAEESVGRWATIFPGGAGLNTASDDYGFVFDPLRNIGYFTSNRPGGKGNEDLYKAEKETDNVVVKVTDAATGKAIAKADIDFKDCGDKTYQTDENGLFNFQLLDDLNCTAVIKKEGFLPSSVKITSLGLRQNRKLDIALTSAQNAYQGKIMNASTGSGLEDAKVIATIQSQSGDEITAFSGPQGGYSIALLPNRTYLLRFSKAGYKDVTLNFKTAEKDTKAIQNIDLQPVGMVVTTTSPAPTPPQNTPTTPIPTPAETPAPATNTGATSKEIPAGFAVQIAAMTSNGKVDLAGYQAKLKGLGEVYSVVEGGKTKVRLGVFANRTEAGVAQKKCRDLGYSGAFTVPENSKKVTSPAATPPPAAPPVPEKPATPSAPAPAKTLDGYMVRLAAFGNMANFKKSNVEDIGVVTLVPKGKMTIVLLSGYDSRESAEIGLRKAKVRGFPDAHLVLGKNGELEKVK